VQEAERELAGRGRVLLRYSGTEPLLRVMVEGPGRDHVEAIAGRLCRIAEEELGS
jgi:phosphoglucosamine mutase